MARIERAFPMEDVAGIGVVLSDGGFVLLSYEQVAAWLGPGVDCSELVGRVAIVRMRQAVDDHGIKNRGEMLDLGSRRLPAKEIACTSAT